MLYYTVKSKSHYTQEDFEWQANFEWHVGEAAVDPSIVLRTISVYADGDELAHILKRYDNIPRVMSGPRHMSWYGDDAKFILGNL